MDKPTASRPWNHLALLWLFMVSFGLAAWFSLVLYRAYPYSMDEYNYTYQARMFARGETSTKLPKGFYALKESYMVKDDERIYSKYPPGTAFLFSLGERLGVMALVNPLLSGLSIVMIACTLRLLVPPAMAYGVAFLLTTNSYFIGYAGSFFSQPAVLFFYALGFYALVRYRMLPSRQYLLLGGAAVGLCMLVRPLDAVILGVALASGVAHISAPWRTLARRNVHVFWLVLPAALGVLALCGWHYYLAGCFCIATYKVWDGEFLVNPYWAPGFIGKLNEVYHQYHKTFWVYTWPVFKKTFVPVLGPVFLLLALCGAWCWKGALKWACLVACAILPVLYNFHSGSGWPQYGSRYWYILLVPLTLLLALGLFEVQKRFGTWAAAAVLVIALAVQPARVLKDVDEYDRRFNIILGAAASLEKACPDGSIAVLTNNYPDLLSKNYFIHFGDLRRNPFPMERIAQKKRLVIYTAGAQQMRAVLPGWPLCYFTNPPLKRTDE